MTRAETLAAIKENLEAEAVYGLQQVHWEHCTTELGHEYCAIGWLLQEVAYLTVQLDVARMGLAAIEATLEDHLASLRRQP